MVVTCRLLGVVHFPLRHDRRYLGARSHGEVKQDDKEQPHARVSVLLLRSEIQENRAKYQRHNDSLREVAEKGSAITSADDPLPLQTLEGLVRERRAKLVCLWPGLLPGHPRLKLGPKLEAEVIIYLRLLVRRQQVCETNLLLVVPCRHHHRPRGPILLNTVPSVSPLTLLLATQPNTNNLLVGLRRSLVRQGLGGGKRYRRGLHLLLRILKGHGHRSLRAFVRIPGGDRALPFAHRPSPLPRGGSLPIVGMGPEGGWNPGQRHVCAVILERKGRRLVDLVLQGRL
mmetsp:Transcript_12775/g.26076  ORF Transcript_12775/g.26076 Transcript_12775/m.26076 type:complete len:286 (-) Transcript_12775:1429-2286(-)